MEGSQITRGRGRPRKTMRETIRKDLEINELRYQFDVHSFFNMLLSYNSCVLGSIFQIILLILNQLLLYTHMLVTSELHYLFNFSGNTVHTSQIPLFHMKQT